MLVLNFILALLVGRLIYINNYNKETGVLDISTDKEKPIIAGTSLLIAEKLGYPVENVRFGFLLLFALEKLVGYLGLVLLIYMLGSIILTNLTDEDKTIKGSEHLD